jgi:hypothetical protein
MEGNTNDITLSERVQTNSLTTTYPTAVASISTTVASVSAHAVATISSHAITAVSSHAHAITAVVTITTILRVEKEQKHKEL